jgi:hypothetical protein
VGCFFFHLLIIKPPDAAPEYPRFRGPLFLKSAHVSISEDEGFRGGGGAVESLPRKPFLTSQGAGNGVYRMEEPDSLWTRSSTTGTASFWVLLKS